MKAIKTFFRYLDEEQKGKFKDEKCLLLISIGQEAHEGERFSSTIKLINSSFSGCTISLYDSLQRYTMALNSIKDPEDFYAISLKEGDFWLDRNKRYYDELTMPFNIVRWEQWIKHPFFENKKNELKKSIESDPSYKLIFESTIDLYLQRYCKNLNDFSQFDQNRANKLCFDYLLEECAVLCLWPELNCQAEIYPSRHNDAFIETKNRFIEPFYPNLLKSVTIGFRNAKQVKPQRFYLLEEDMNVQNID